MDKSMWHGCVIFVFAMMITGCSKPGDKLMKDKIQVLNNMAAEFEKVSDKASLDKAMTEIQSHGKTLEKIDQAFAALPQDAQEAAQTAHKAEFDAATERFASAKLQARTKAK